MEKIIKIQDAINFSQFAKAHEDDNIPFSLAHRIYKIYISLINDIEFYYTKQKGIIEQFAQKNELGEVVHNDEQGTISLNPDTIEECKKALDELEELEVTLDFVPITEEELSNCGIKVKLSEMAAIEQFIA